MFHAETSAIYVAAGGIKAAFSSSDHFQILQINQNGIKSTSTASPPLTAVTLPGTVQPPGGTVPGGSTTIASGIGSTVSGTAVSPPGSSTSPHVPTTAMATSWLPASMQSILNINGRLRLGKTPVLSRESQGLAFQGKLYFFGGFDGNWKHMFKYSYAYESLTGKWEQLADIPLVNNGSGITHAGQVGYERDNAIILIGGIQLGAPGTETYTWPSAVSQSAVYRYHTDTGEWDTDLPPIPIDRGGGGCAIIDDTLYFVGGVVVGKYFPKKSNPYNFLDDHREMWSLDLTNSSATWQVRPSMKYARNHIGVVAHSGYLFAVGGQLLELEGCENKDVVERFDPVTDTWMDVASLDKPIGHITPSIFTIPEGIVILGGVTNHPRRCNPPGNNFNEARFYDPRTNTWAVHYLRHKGSSLVCGAIGEYFYIAGPDDDFMRFHFSTFTPTTTTPPITTEPPLQECTPYDIGQGDRSLGDDYYSGDAGSGSDSDSGSGSEASGFEEEVTSSTTMTTTTTESSTSTTTGQRPHVFGSTSRITFGRPESLGVVPAPAREAQGVMVNDILYYFGGFDGNWQYMFKHSYAYDTVQGVWHRLADIPLATNGSGITHAGQAYFGGSNSIILVAGLQLGYSVESGKDMWPYALSRADVYQYMIDSDTWQALPRLPATRGGGAASVVGSTLFYSGGSSYGAVDDGSHTYNFLNDYDNMWSLDLNNPSAGWFCRAPLPQGRNHIGAAVWGGLVYTIGGQELDKEGCANYDRVDVYNPILDLWMRAPDLPVPAGHITPSTVAFSEGIVVVGGTSDRNDCYTGGRTLAQVMYYNPLSAAWYTSRFPIPASAAVAGFADNALYLVADDVLHRVPFRLFHDHTAAS